MFIESGACFVIGRQIGLASSVHAFKFSFALINSLHIPLLIQSLYFSKLLKTDPKIK